MFKLTIEDDEGKTTVIPVIRDEMTIGRQDGNTIRLTERNISRKHARLVRQNGTMYVEDLASYTGVRVNGARIVAMTPVAEGDEVQIGDYKLMVRIDRPAVASNPDRATMPAMPAALGPMNSVGGSVAIPTRGTPAMAGQAAPGPTRQSPVVPQEAARISQPAPVVRPSAPVPHGVSGVPDPLEAQPTIPVRTLAEAASPQSSTQTNARLVVLTSELAGHEFSLVRASVVIGRTEENDIVINHRSISRHHAKIVREGDRYTIVDLQSANGVRVNNEDYERIELNPGDVVELGHVKLRFVGPFEHYVFDPNVKHDKRPFPTKLVAGAGAAVVIAAIAAFVLRGSRGSEPAAVSASAMATQASPAAAAPPSGAP
ncbi:MAG TPA: FHA domain-containing protein, partial [Polyangia bacterium]|nr:FHA domain-containing protein [Polyangia bacterium]